MPTAITVNAGAKISSIRRKGMLGCVPPILRNSQELSGAMDNSLHTKMLSAISYQLHYTESLILEYEQPRDARRRREHHRRIESR